jgi:NAD(P)H-hydrate epimerase
MKILTSIQIKEVERSTMLSQSVTGIDLIERAAEAFILAFLERVSRNRPVCILCGPGNNGNDGRSIAIRLFDLGYSVQVFNLQSKKISSVEDNYFNSEIWKRSINAIDLSHGEQLTQLLSDCIIIDALFGIGLNRKLNDLQADVASQVNQLNTTVVSVDIPSGMFADDENENADVIIQADYTFTFHSPKPSFYFSRNEYFLGKWKVLPIGLAEYNVETSWEQIESKDIAEAIHQRSRFGHKGTYGHALIIAGSYGKMGAAILSTKACLRSGAGLVTAHIPRCGYEIMQVSVPEAMVSSDEGRDIITNISESSKFKAAGIGPGIGINPESAIALEDFLKRNQTLPLVLDADALNILASNKNLLDLLPPKAILTPHPKEFDRISNEHLSEIDRINSATKFARRYNVILVLKGAFTSIHFPDGHVFFNATGNPGMATGGSGDVLTGIITGLLAQGYLQEEAARIGVHLNGNAGDFAALHLGEEAMLAGDIVYFIGDAYKAYHKMKEK